MQVMQVPYRLHEEDKNAAEQKPHRVEVSHKGRLSGVAGAGNLHHVRLLNFEFVEPARRPSTRRLANTGGGGH